MLSHLEHRTAVKEARKLFIEIKRGNIAETRAGYVSINFRVIGDFGYFCCVDIYEVFLEGRPTNWRLVPRNPEHRFLQLERMTNGIRESSTLTLVRVKKSL